MKYRPSFCNASSFSIRTAMFVTNDKDTDIASLNTCYYNTIIEFKICCCYKYLPM